MPNNDFFDNLQLNSLYTIALPPIRIPL